MNGNKYKILIIEDDEHINNLVATLLEANGYQTLSAYSCEDGMMMYASHRPDLVVLDLGLPDQDGMTFLKRLRKDSLTPVIVLSARSDEKDKVEALDMGANDYVTKPFGSNDTFYAPHDNTSQGIRNAGWKTYGLRATRRCKEHFFIAWRPEALNFPREIFRVMRCFMW